jgi:hypothetical protein
MRVSKGLCVASLLLIVSCGTDALAQPARPTGTGGEKPRELEQLDRYNEYKAMLEEVLKLVGTLRIQVEPAGAEVLIDGKSEGKAPFEDPSFVDPGKHTIEVKLDGYKPAQVVVDMAAGSSKDILIMLGQEERRSGDGAPSSSQPGASGGVEPKKEEGPPAGVPPIVIGGLIATGAFYAASIGFMVAAENRAVAYNGLARNETFTDLTVITALLGGALCVGTSIYAMTLPFSRPESATYIVPMASINSGGVMLTGRW